MARTFGCTVRELYERIDSVELTEWMAYYQLEPWGPERDNLHAGIVAKAVYDVNQDPKRRREISPADFLMSAPDPRPVNAKPAANVMDKARQWAIMARGG